MVYFDRNADLRKNGRMAHYTGQVAHLGAVIHHIIVVDI